MSDKGKFRLSEYDETIRFVLENDGEFRLYPRGTSMLPLIVEGRDSVCLVKPEGELKKNDIAFYLRDDGHYVLHRVRSVKGGCYNLCGDNQTVVEDGICDRHIIGVVNKIYRKDKVITEKSFGYRVYLILWRAFFVRKIYHKFKALKRKFS